MRDVFNKIYVISSTATVNGAYDFLPKQYVHTVFDDKLIEEIISQQENYYKKGHTPKVLIILDDIVGCEGFKEKCPPPILKKLYTCYRHYGISLIFCSQNIRTVPLLARQQAGFWFLFRQLNVSKEILYEE